MRSSPWGVVNGQERFDANVASHPHFVCHSCGAVLDLPGVSVDDLTHEVSRRYGVEVHHQKLEFFGVCPACLKRGTATENER